MTLLSRRDAIGAALLLCSRRALLAQDAQPQPQTHMRLLRQLTNGKNVGLTANGVSWVR